MIRVVAHVAALVLSAVAIPGPSAAQWRAVGFDTGEGPVRIRWTPGADGGVRAPEGTGAREGLGGDSRRLLFAPSLVLPSAPRAAEEAGPSPLVPAGLSLLLPGAGQHRLGQGRKWAYAALEVIGWTLFLERRAAGADYRDRYRDFAWDTARLQIGPRVDGDFEYYETLSKWTASGLFDADPARSGVQPEMDPSTFNGAIWALASQIFIPGGGPVPESDPAYQRALDYYVDRAYGTEFLWDWSGAPGGREELGGLIEASDDRFRQATTALGAVIANHLVSAVDAYLSARGRAVPASLSFVPAAGVLGPAWGAVLSIPVGR